LLYNDNENNDIIINEISYLIL